MGRPGIKSIRANVAANAVGKIWITLLSVLFVPVYLQLLGAEAYGIVTFFAVMQSVLNLMGVGLQRTLRREFADTPENEAPDQINERKYRLLRSGETVYFGVCALIVLFVALVSERAATGWLNYETLNPREVAGTITLMGASIGLQMIANLYLGCLFGLDHQIAANVLQMLWVTVKQVGVIPVLLLIRPSAGTFYGWHVLNDVVFCIIFRLAVLHLIPVSGKHRWTFRDFSNLKGIWKYAAGILVISTGSVFNTQLDKIVMSRYLPVTYCGAYNSTYHIAGFAAYVPTIIGTAVFSRIAAMLFNGKRKEAEGLFHYVNKKSVLVVSAMSAFIAVFSYDILLVWTQSSMYADIMKTAAPFVVIGMALNALQQVPYDYLLASGNTRINEVQVFACIPYVLLVTFPMTKRFGVNGAAYAWAAEMLISTILYLYFFYRTSFGRGAVRWLLREIFPFFLLPFLPAFSLKQLLKSLGMSSAFQVFCAVLTGGLTLLLMFVLFDRSLFQKR